MILKVVEVQTSVVMSQQAERRKCVSFSNFLGSGKGFEEKIGVPQELDFLLLDGELLG